MIKVEELVARSNGRVRADMVHARLVAMGFGGEKRTTRRAVAEVKARLRAGQRRVFRPWVAEPGAPTARRRRPCAPTLLDHARRA